MKNQNSRLCLWIQFLCIIKLGKNGSQQRLKKQFLIMSQWLALECQFTAKGSACLTVNLIAHSLINPPPYHHSKQKETEQFHCASKVKLKRGNNRALAPLKWNLVKYHLLWQCDLSKHCKRMCFHLFRRLDILGKSGVQYAMKRISKTPGWRLLSHENNCPVPLLTNILRLSE